MHDAGVEWPCLIPCGPGVVQLANDPVLHCRCECLKLIKNIFVGVHEIHTIGIRDCESLFTFWIRLSVGFVGLPMWVWCSQDRQGWPQACGSDNIGVQLI